MRTEFGSTEGFEIRVSYSGPSVVVAVHGEVDISTATQLGDIVTAVIEGGHTSVVLDLARCAFLDASGLGVITDAAQQLSNLPSSQTFTVRAPSDMVHRIMVFTGMDQVLMIEQPRSTLSSLGREQTTRGTGNVVGIDADTVAHALRLVTAIPADRDVVDGALRLVVALAQATIGGADGVSISLSRHGSLSTVAASDQTILDMDADQYATGEGPCVDASTEGRWFHVESLDSETRWPAFIPKARTLGINAILSNPLLVGDRPLGALNIYSNRSGAFKVKDQRLAAVFATEASTVLTSVGARVTDEETTGRLVAALRTREIISQAQGILMNQDGVPADAAYALLRESSPRRLWRSVWDLEFGPPLQLRCTLNSGPATELEQGRVDSGLTHGELFLRYFELGGMSSALQLEAFLYDALQPTAHDHDIVAHALNERFVEMGGNHPVHYRSDEPDEATSRR